MITKLFHIQRGAPISDEDRKKLNLQAGSLFGSLGIDMFDYDALRKVGYAGYAEYYIRKCWDESEMKNKADVTIYKQFLKIDSKLGTTQTEQLFTCLFYSPRKDLIEVGINFLSFF